MMISFYPVRENVMPPSRANPSDAGMDVFFCPDKNASNGGVKGTATDCVDGIVSIAPGKNAILPTGLKFGIPHGYMLQVCNRSSMGAKKNLLAGAHVIDSGYAGEVFIDLHDVGDAVQTVTPGDKIAQLVMIPVIAVTPIIATHEESLYGMTPITISNRGDGALGSTGK